MDVPQTVKDLIANAGDAESLTLEIGFSSPIPPVVGGECGFVAAAVPTMAATIVDYVTQNGGVTTYTNIEEGFLHAELPVDEIEGLFNIPGVVRVDEVALESPIGEAPTDGDFEPEGNLEARAKWFQDRSGDASARELRDQVRDEIPPRDRLKPHEDE